MKKNFLAGFIILMPLYLTYIICSYVINLLTSPFVRNLETYTNEHLLLTVVLQLFVLLSMLLFIMFAGILAEAVIGNYFFAKLDHLFNRIPLVNRIYRSLKEIIETIFHSKSSNFTDVVLAPYPYSEIYSIGFVTQCSAMDGQISVFLPGVPNPTVGFIVQFERSRVFFLDVKVEEAMKYLISCGTVVPQFKVREQI